MKRALLLGLSSVLAVGCHDNKGAEGPAERAGQGVDRAAKKTGEALQRAAKKTDAAARKAVQATGAAFEKAGRKLQKNSGATPSRDDDKADGK